MRIHTYATVRREMPEGAIMTKVVTYLMVIALAVLLSWMSERDSHPFNDVNVQVGS